VTFVSATDEWDSVEESKVFPVTIPVFVRPCNVDVSSVVGGSGVSDVLNTVSGSRIVTAGDSVLNTAEKLSIELELATLAVEFGRLLSGTDVD